MVGRLVVAVMLVTAGAALAPGPAAAGGWATVGLDSVPPDIRAGEPWVVRLTILQHGRTPLEGLQPQLTISTAGTTRTFAATSTGRPGVYRARIVFPYAGRWRYVVDDDFSARHSFGPVHVAERGASAKVPLAASIPSARDKGTGGGSWGLASAAALAAGLIAAGVVILLQRLPRGRRTATEE
jgi:hypothetical protein